MKLSCNHYDGFSSTNLLDSPLETEINMGVTHTEESIRLWNHHKCYQPSHQNWQIIPWEKQLKSHDKTPRLHIFFLSYFSMPSNRFFLIHIFLILIFNTYIFSTQTGLIPIIEFAITKMGSWIRELSIR